VPEPADSRNVIPISDLLERLAVGRALLESKKRQRVPPAIKRGAVETLFGRYWQEILIIENGERRWEVFSDSTLHGLGAKVAAREKELL
jgi:hypothetical protein